MPSIPRIWPSIRLDYKLALNVLGLTIFAVMFGLTAGRGASDPVCGMKVDRAKALTAEHAGRTFYFCSEHCRHSFEADPDRYLSAHRTAGHAHTAHAHR